MATVKIHLTSEDLLQLRFAYSPLIELVTSYKRLYSNKPQRLYQRWLEDAAEAVNDLEFPYLHTLTVGTNYIPDFLTPTPTVAGLTLEDEIEQMLNLPNEMIRKNMQYLIETNGDSELRQQFLVYPREVLLCLVDELRLYWARALAHHWTRITSILEGDVLYRARQLAVEGPAPLLTELHPNVIFQGTVPDQNTSVLEVSCIEVGEKPRQTAYLQFEKKSDPACITIETSLNGTGLQLVPALFAADHIFWQIVPEWRPMIIYGVRGMGLWQQSAAETNYSLEIALGAGRARVLQALIRPANTGEVARRLEISAGAVSQHLSRLGEAGLVEPHRSGKRVFYQLTRRGRELIELFDRTY